MYIWFSLPSESLENIVRKRKKEKERYKRGREAGVGGRLDTCCRYFVLKYI